MFHSTNINFFSFNYFKKIIKGRFKDFLPGNFLRRESARGGFVCRESHV